MENMMGKQIAISKKCVEYFFSEKEDVTGYGYCETDSYIVFTEIKNGSDEGKIVAMHKQSLERKDITEVMCKRRLSYFSLPMLPAKTEEEPVNFSINDCKKLFDEKRITSVGDKIYFFNRNSSLHCYDLENGKHTCIFGIDTVPCLVGMTKFFDDILVYKATHEKAMQPEVIENAHHLVINNNNVFYISGSSLFHLMLKDNKVLNPTEITPPDDYDLCMDCGFTVYDGNLYFVQEALSGIGDGREEIKSGYQIVKYSLAEKEFSVASDIFFAYEPLERISEVLKFHAHKNYLCVVVAWNFPVCTTGEYDGYDGFCIDVSCEKDNVSSVYFWQSHIYQMEFFGRYIIYNNADKNYTIYKHDFINDKRSPLVNNCGSTEKASLMDKLTFGSGEFQHPHKYLLIGNWLKCKSRFAEGLIDLEDAEEESYEPNIVEEIIDTIAEILPF